MRQPLRAESVGKWVGALLVVSLAGALFFHRLGAASLSGDESIYAQVSREAAEAGRWWPLTYHGRTFFDKPPLALWASAVSMKLFEPDETAVRVVPALAGVMTVALVYFFACSLFGIREAVLTGLFLSTAFHFTFSHGVRSGVPDSMLVLLISAALLVHVRKRGRSPDTWPSAALTGALLGLGLWTKEAVAWLAVAAIVLFELLRALRTGAARIAAARIAATVSVVLLFQAMSLGMLRQVARGRTWDFLRRDLWLRFRTGINPGHLDAGTYERTLRFDFGAALLVVPFAAFFLVRLYREKEDALFERVLFLAIWAAMIVLPFECSISKLSWYIYPAYPAIALLLGWTVVRLADEASTRQPIAGKAILLLAALFLALRAGRSWGEERAPVRHIDAQRLAEYVSSNPGVSLCREPGLRMREWNEYYLWPVTSRVRDAHACGLVLTDRPDRYSDAGVAGHLHRFANADLRESPLFVVAIGKPLPENLFRED